MGAQSFRLHRSAVTRMLVITMLAVLIFYAMGLYLNYMGLRTANENLEQTLQADVQYITGEIRQEIVNLNLLEQEVAGNQKLLRLIVAGDVLSDYQRVECITDVSNQLFRLKRFSGLVDSARVFLPGTDRAILADQTIYDDVTEADRALLRAAAASPDATALPHEGGIELTFSRAYGEGLLLVALGVQPENLLEALKSMSRDDGTELFILREDDALAAATTEAIEPAAGPLAAPVWRRVGRDTCIFAEGEIPQLGVRVQCCRRVNSVLVPFTRHRLWVWILTLVTAGLLVAYVLYFGKAVYHPLNTIYKAMGEMEGPGDFEINEPGNEFQDIYTQFQYMVHRLEHLAGQVYEERYRAKEAELIQLQTQINPHFFYNTLFLIYRMARDEGNEEIAELSGHLSRFYRYITKSPNQTVALRDEVEHISNYLEIQRIRFQPRISIEVEPLPDAIAGEQIPSLIVQPLVENAFTHGVKDAAWKARVCLRYEYGDDWFRVIVADNGGRMTEAKVEEIRRMLEESDQPGGSALSNLKRRMELRYGEGYGLALACVDDGLTASVTFPRGKEATDDAVAADRG